MFNLQGSELIIVLLLALVVLGPEKLPEAMRRLGQFYGQLKKMSTGFQQEFRSAIDEPVREVRQTANTLRESVDFRKLQDNQRPEKPKSAEMADFTPPAPRSETPSPADSATAAVTAPPAVNVPFEPLPDDGVPDPQPQPPDDVPAADDSMPPVDVAAPPTAPTTAHTPETPDENPHGEQPEVASE